MLILSRRESESIHLGDDIVLTIVRVSGEKVRIGVQAPAHIKVLRTELEISSVVEVLDKAKSIESSPVEIALNSNQVVSQPSIVASSLPPKRKHIPITVKRAA